MTNRGSQVKRDATFRAGDLARFGRILFETLVRGGPRRTWFTLRLLGGTLARRPSAFREAVSFAIVHRAFHEYLEALAEKLDAAIEDIERTTPPPPRDPTESANTLSTI